MSNETEPIPAPLAYRAHQVAALLGVHPQTVRSWIRNGELRCVRAGNTLLIPTVELERFLAGDAS